MSNMKGYMKMGFGIAIGGMIAVFIVSLLGLNTSVRARVKPYLEERWKR